MDRVGVEPTTSASQWSSFFRPVSFEDKKLIQIPPSPLPYWLGKERRNDNLQRRSYMPTIIPSTAAKSPIHFPRDSSIKIFSVLLILAISDIDLIGFSLS
jgi:hypothetical protein